MLSSPFEFQQSFIDCTEYPLNLISKNTYTYRSTLAAYKQRLHQIESDLCLVAGSDDVSRRFEVHFRDLATADGKCTKASPHLYP